MPTSTSEPADRHIRRFLRDRELGVPVHGKAKHPWSASNLASATYHLNRVHGWLAERGLGLLHDDAEELVDALNEHIAERLQRSSPNSVIVEYRQLAAFYNWATTPRVTGSAALGFNPMPHVIKPSGVPADPARKPAATSWQYEALMATCRPSRAKRRGRGPVPGNHERDAAIIALLWHTGMRRSEVSKLDYDHVKWQTEQIYVDNAKGWKSRWVPVPREAMEILEDWLDKRGNTPGPLFGSATHPGRGLAPDSISLMLKHRAERAARTLGVAASEIYAPTHSFRRAVAIDHLANGGDPTALIRNHGWARSTAQQMLIEYTEPGARELTDAEMRRVAKLRATNRRPELKVVG